MAVFYAGFFVNGDPGEISRFKNKLFRSYDEKRGEYGPYQSQSSHVIIDFTAICPKLRARQKLLDKGNPRTHMSEYRGYDIDKNDYDGDALWFQFTIDNDFPVDLFKMIAAEFPDLVFSGSAYEEDHEF